MVTASPSPAGCEISAPEPPPRPARQDQALRKVPAAHHPPAGHPASCSPSNAERYSSISAPPPRSAASRRPEEVREGIGNSRWGASSTTLPSTTCGVLLPEMKAATSNSAETPHDSTLPYTTLDNSSQIPNGASLSSWLGKLHRDVHGTAMQLVRSVNTA